MTAPTLNVHIWTHPNGAPAFIDCWQEFGTAEAACVFCELLPKQPRFAVRQMWRLPQGRLPLSGQVAYFRVECGMQVTREGRRFTSTPTRWRSLTRALERRGIEVEWVPSGVFPTREAFETYLGGAS